MLQRPSTSKSSASRSTVHDRIRAARERVMAADMPATAEAKSNVTTSPTPSIDFNISITALGVTEELEVPPSSAVPSTASDTLPISPSTMPHASTSRDGIDGDLDVKPPSPANRITLTLQDGRVTFSSTVVRKMTIPFRQRVDPKGSTWKKLSPETIDFYWREFQNHCQWDPSIEPAIYKAWNSRAGARYSDYLHRIRRGEVRTPHIPQAILDRWKQDWAAEDLAASHERNRRNRRHGDVSAPAESTHTAGSRSHIDTALRIERQTGRKPTFMETFMYTHTKNHDKQTWVNKKARQVAENYKRVTQELEKEGDPPPPDEVFIDVAGGLTKKQRIYGIGSLARTMPHLDTCSTSNSTASDAQAAVDTDSLQNNPIIQELLKTMRDLQSRQLQVEEQLAKLGVQFDRSPEPDNGTGTGDAA